MEHNNAQLIQSTLRLQVMQLACDQAQASFNRVDKQYNYHLKRDGHDTAEYFCGGEWRTARARLEQARTVVQNELAWRARMRGTLTLS